MANRLPIINTFLDNGVNYLVPKNVGITCKIKDSQEIYLAINQLINNNDTYNEKSSESFKNLSRFEYKKMISNFRKMLTEI